MKPDLATSADRRTAEPPAPAGDSARRLSLSRDLGEFLIEFSIALNRTVMYPEGHPSLDDAAAVVVHHLSSLLYERATLSIGVAQRQLVIDGVATDVSNPVLRSLAERLHHHHIGAITFRQGLAPREILDALKLLAMDRGPEDRPLGLGDASRLSTGPHVRLYPLTYERLEMVDEADAAETDADDPHRNSRLASLWIGMARAALASEDGEEGGPDRIEPMVVARAINEHPATQAYDQVIVGYLLQIAGELKTEGGAATAAVRRHLSRLIEGLNDDSLQRLLSMGGDIEQRHSFLLDAVDGMAADAIVDLAGAAGRAANRTLSEPLLRVLAKLATLAEAGIGRTSVAADTALREEIRRLIATWTAQGATLSYAAALDASNKMTGSEVAGAPDRDRPEPARLLHMTLELDAPCPAADRALDALIEAGESAAVLGAIAVAEAGDATEAVWRRLGASENILRLLALDSLDAGALDRVLTAARPAVVATALIDAILAGVIAPDHSNALTAMTRLGPEIAEEAGRRLSSDQPEVRRGILSFLNEFGIIPDGVSPLAAASDPDPLVRREALRLALLLPHERERAIGTAITDSDMKVVRVGVRAIEGGVPETAIALVAGRAGDGALPMDLRTVIARALGTVRSALARDALLRVSTAGTSWLGRPRLAQRSTEMLAGLAGLAQLWADDPKAAIVLKRARASSDPATRAAAGAAA